MTPLEASPQTSRFILTRRDATCPFCPTNSPLEAMEADLDRPIPFTRDEIRVEDHEGQADRLHRGAQTAFFKYPDSDHSFVARYARAIAYYRETETERALDSIDDLLREYPNNPYLWELKGQVLFEAGRMRDAVPAHQRSVDRSRMRLCFASTSPSP